MWTVTRAYPSVIAELRQAGELSPSCRCRPSLYMNNVIEQDHRFIKKRIHASQGFHSVQGALSTIRGYEAMHMIRKGQIRWEGDAASVSRTRDGTAPGLRQTRPAGSRQRQLA